MEIMEKRCSACGRVLPVEMFGRLKTSKDGLRPMCKECYNAKTREYYEKKRERGGDKSLHKVYSNPDLAHFTPRQLMEELKARGFRWEYMLEPQRKIMYDKI